MAGKMKVVPVINLKGGVAKTTTVRNMAYVLSTKYNKKVLVADLDESGSLSDGFGCKQPNNVMCGMARLMTTELIMPGQECPVRDVISHTKYEGIDIIDANGTIGAAKRVLLSESGKLYTHYIFHEKIKDIQDEYDFLLADCTPDSNLLEENVLVASHEIIIPAEADTDAINRAVDTIAALNEVRSYAKDAPVFLRGVLFTKVGTTSMDKQTILKEYPPFFRVFDTYIRNSVIARQSRNKTIMCSELHKGSTIAMDYDNFVAEFLGEDLPHVNGASRAKLRELEMQKAAARTSEQ